MTFNIKFDINNDIKKDLQKGQDKMDASDKYIKMCEKADEIQKLWEPKPFQDFIVKKSNKVFSTLGVNEQGHFTFGIIPVDLGNVIWLPRQDQLQEILLKRDPNKYIESLVSDFYFFVDSCDYGKQEMDSFDQYWLAYVMYDTYHKIWSGENWSRELYEKHRGE